MIRAGATPTTFRSPFSSARPIAPVTARSAATYLVGEGSLDAERTAANEAVPILQVHGSHDGVVAPTRGKAAKEALERRGYRVAFHEYPMQHEVCWEEIVVVADFLRTVLA